MTSVRNGSKAAFAAINPRKSAFRVRRPKAAGPLSASFSLTALRPSRAFKLWARLPVTGLSALGRWRPPFFLMAD